MTRISSRLALSAVLSACDVEHVDARLVVRPAPGAPDARPARWCAALLGANTRSWMPQPKSGSIGRSPRRRGEDQQDRFLDALLGSGLRDPPVRRHLERELPADAEEATVGSLRLHRGPHASQDFGAAAGGRVEDAPGLDVAVDHDTLAGRGRQMDFPVRLQQHLGKRITGGIAICDLDLEARQRADLDVARGLHGIALQEHARFVRAMRLCVGRVERHGEAGIRGRRGEGEAGLAALRPLSLRRAALGLGEAYAGSIAACRLRRRHRRRRPRRPSGRCRRASPARLRPWRSRTAASSASGRCPSEPWRHVFSRHPTPGRSRAFRGRRARRSSSPRSRRRQCRRRTWAPPASPPAASRGRPSNRAGRVRERSAWLQQIPYAWGVGTTDHRVRDERAALHDAANVAMAEFTLSTAASSVTAAAVTFAVVQLMLRSAGALIVTIRVRSP